MSHVAGSSELWGNEKGFKCSVENIWLSQKNEHMINSLTENPHARFMQRQNVNSRHTGLFMEAK